MRRTPLPASARWQPLAVLMLVLTATALLLGLGGQAHAHAALVDIQPADGAVVAHAPQSFSLSFSEPTSPLVLKLVRPDGSSTVLDRYTLRDATLDIAAPTDLSSGTHVLTWRVISEDGHPVGGSSIFSIGAPSAGGLVAPQEAVDWPLRIAIWAARTLLYAGLFIGVGGVFFTSFVGGGTRTVRRTPAMLILAGLAAVLLSVGLQGLDALDLPLGSIAAALPWKTGLATSYGLTAKIAAASLIAGLTALAVPRQIGRVLALLAFIGIGLALSASGHASAAHPQWLTRPAVFLHAVGIAFWAGALLPLGVAFASRTSEAERLLRRFSRLIPVALLPLVAGGMLLAAIQLASPSALWTTAYGRVLLAKLVLLAALFALAALNRFRLTGPAEAGDSVAAARLARSIRIEIILVLAIFAVAAAWRFTPPPRALAEAAARPAELHIHTEKAMAEVTVSPGHVGPVSVGIVIMTGDFGPLDAKGLTLIVSNPAAGIEPIRRTATKGTDAVWRVDKLDLPLPGRWQIRLDILVSDFELVKIEDAIDIRP